jgi:WD40 repeat protein
VTGLNAFELAHPEPLLPHPTLLHPKPTTTSANPITNLSFSPRRVDILAVASSDGSGSSQAGKVVAIQGPGSTSYDKEAEDAFLKEIEEGMKGKGRKVEPPKVEIWNISSKSLLLPTVTSPTHPVIERQIITTIHLAHSPVFLAFHPSAKQLAIVCFDSRERNDYVVFAWQPEAVEAEGDLAFEDADAGVERAKREQEREAYRALLARQQAGEESAKEEGWQIRTDIRLGEKNYRVSELNGAMFGPCGTRMYAGNHDGRLNVWDYPIKRVVPEVLEDDKAEGAKSEVQEGEAEKETENEETQEDDEDAPMRRSNESHQSTDPTDGDKPQPSAEEDTPMDAEEQSKSADKEDGETASAPDAADNSGDTDQPAHEADEDVKMEDAEQPGEEVKPSEEVKPNEEEKSSDTTKPLIDSEPAQADEKNETASQPEPTTTTVTKTAPAPTPTPPAPPAQMLKYLYGQVVNSGCLNCIDIDPRRRYIATGGSEGMVSLCEVGEWIGVAAFDSYT